MRQGDNSVQNNTIGKLGAFVDRDWLIIWLANNNPCFQ